MLIFCSLKSTLPDSYSGILLVTVAMLKLTGAFIVKCFSCRQHIYGSCFCIHSAGLCLLVGAFNLFTFKVIIDMFVPITIFLIVLGLLL